MRDWRKLQVLHYSWRDISQGLSHCVSAGFGLHYSPHNAGAAAHVFTRIGLVFMYALNYYCALAWCRDGHCGEGGS
ncbi:hypothetical protein D3C86_1810180 [compost metagenome]